MRDPVERLWSSARMRKRKMQGSEKESFDEFDFLSSCEEGSDQELKQDTKQQSKILKKSSVLLTFTMDFTKSYLVAALIKKLKVFRGQTQTI